MSAALSPNSTSCHSSSCPTTTSTLLRQRCSLSISRAVTRLSPSRISPTARCWSWLPTRPARSATRSCARASASLSSTRWPWRARSRPPSRRLSRPSHLRSPTDRRSLSYPYRKKAKRSRKETITRRAGTEDEPNAAVDLPARIGHALALGATAIHFEPRSSGMVISGRVEGPLRELGTLPDGDRVTDELTRLTGIDVAQATRPHRAQRAADRVPGGLGRAGGRRPSDDSWSARHSPSGRRSPALPAPLRARSRHISNARRSRPHLPGAAGCSFSAERLGARSQRRSTPQSRSSMRHP